MGSTSSIVGVPSSINNKVSHHELPTILAKPPSFENFRSRENSGETVEVIGSYDENALAEEPEGMPPPDLVAGFGGRRHARSYAGVFGIPVRPETEGDNYDEEPEGFPPGFVIRVVGTFNGGSAC